MLWFENIPPPTTPDYRKSFPVRAHIDKSSMRLTKQEALCLLLENLNLKLANLYDIVRRRTLRRGNSRAVANFFIHQGLADW